MIRTHAPEETGECGVGGLVSCNAKTEGPKTEAEVERARLLARDRGFYRWCSGRVE